LVFELVQENAYNPHQVRGSPLPRRVLNTRIPRDYFSIKMSLDNYDGLVDSRELMQKVQNSLELVIQDSNAMRKILHKTFHGFTSSRAPG